MTRFAGNHICGLYYTTGFRFERVYLPQVQLESHTTINPVCFTTSLTQTFRNSADAALRQVRYAFPLYDGVAVSAYSITYGSCTLKGIVQQKDDAKHTYQAAVDRGETAGLLESLPAGIFGVTLGNVPSKTDVVVEITYCGELKHDAGVGGLRYNLPTAIAPRYGEYPGAPFETNALPKGGIKITVDIDMAGSAIRKVQSPSHPISVSSGSLSTMEGSKAPFVPSQASATLALGSTELAQDFVLQLLIDDVNKPRALIETHPTLPNQRAIMATLVPNFALDPISPEIVFIADQSGSMAGSKNDALKASLLVFLKSLPLGVRFNICAFGSHYKLLWKKSQAYNEDNLKTAIAFVDGFTAGYGGTEILEPITATFKSRWADLPLEIMLLTDGEVWAQDAVFDYINRQIRDEKVDARIFTLGIGSDVSHTLVEGVARAGNGFSQFVTQNEEIDQKIVRMLKCALYAHTKDYEIEVHYGERDHDEMPDDFEIVEKVKDCLMINDKGQEPLTTTSTIAKKVKSFFDQSVNVDKTNTQGDKTNRYAHLPYLDTPKVVQAPHEIPPLFPFNRTTLYLLLGPTSSQKDVTSVILRATSPDGPLELSIPVQNSSFTDKTTIHQLGARKAIQDLEEGRGWVQASKAVDGQSINSKYGSRIDEIVERECASLGEQFQVAGKYTSFVAVDENGKTETIQAQEATQETEAPLFRAAPRKTLASKAMRKSSAQPPPAAPPSGGFGGALFGSSMAAGVQRADQTPFSAPRAAFGSVASTAIPTASSFAGFNATPFDSMAADQESFSVSSQPEERRKKRISGGAMRHRRIMVQDTMDDARDEEMEFDEANQTRDRERSFASKMHVLINLQTFSGAWLWKEELFPILGIDKRSVNLRDFGDDSNVCATALAVALLETNFSSQKDVWEMIVAKARQWLGTQVGKDVDTVVAKASSFL